MKIHSFLFAILLFLSPLFGAFNGGTTNTLSTGTSNVQPDVAVDPSGNAVAVWSVLISNEIFASRFNGTKKEWSAPVQIGTGGSVQVDSDQNGNAIAIWVDTLNQIQTARFNAKTSTWGTFVQLTTTGINSSPVIAVNSPGNAVAAWSTFPNQIQGSTFNVKTLTWSVLSVLAPNAGFQQVSVNQHGFGIIVWQNFSTGSIQAFRFTFP